MILMLFKRHVTRGARALRRAALSARYVVIRRAILRALMREAAHYVAYERRRVMSRERIIVAWLLIRRELRVIC